MMTGCVAVYVHISQSYVYDQHGEIKHSQVRVLQDIPSVRRKLLIAIASSLVKLVDEQPG
jgi:hypothetical protein